MQKILVVDDEFLVRDSIALSLKGGDYAVETAESGEQALAMVVAGHYDLVLTDMRMTGMSGQELAKELKSTHAGLSMILVTGFPPEDISDLFDAVILKPFSIAELRKRVHSTLALSNAPA